MLINNAAAGGARRELTADGVERTWAVSYLAPFLLTTLLIDMLTASAPARVVNVTSAAQAMGRLDLDDVEFVRRRYRPFAAYAQAKLALVLFTVELAGRLDGTGVTVTSVHPGGARTNMGGQLDARGPAAWGARLTWLLSRSPEAAAHGTVRLATAPEAGGTGGYLVNRPGKAPKPGRANRLAHDADARRALWELSERMVRRPGRFTS
ncbi:short chain dehydrogenase [Jiangella alkaliphila]|uniref:Short chain dehydrogenase n=1 Tax=Jiangella alkaliphila TaxID=419479 RepID=A0A1H2J2V2_9ACTN|nr:short chain dehydrogenase [Jiangella alkaliphila]